MPDDRTGAVRLADSDLWLVPEADDVGGPDQLVPAWGGTMRDGLGVLAGRGGVEIAIVGGLVLDPVLGVRRASIGIVDGRVVAVGRAGNPDTMDGVAVVLDPSTAVLDATGLIVTPGAVDTHVHWLSPQVGDAALAGGVTTLVVQDYGPVWNLGNNPATGLRATWAALEDQPLNVAALVRASSADPEPVEASLRAGGAGLKIHEDVGAGPPQLRTALDIADRHDVQLAVHTDGLNEAIDVRGTLEVLEGRTIHAFHIEGCGGGHAPDLLELASADHVMTSSTNPTVPFGPASWADGYQQVAAVHLAQPGVRHGDLTAMRLRVREGTMAAESVLHDLGVIPILTSDSQGMGRIGEVVRRALQTADAMKAQRAWEGPPGPADNERVLRYVAKVTINPAVAHGLADDVGSLQPGRLADAVLWAPANVGVRPELVVKAGIAAWGVSGDGNATTSLAEPTRVRSQIGALGAAPAALSLAFLAHSAMDADLPSTRRRAPVGGCRGLTAADMVRNDRRGAVRVDPVTAAVMLDGEAVAAEPVQRLAFGPRHLLG